LTANIANERSKSKPEEAMSLKDKINRLMQKETEELISKSKNEDNLKDRQIGRLKSLILFIPDSLSFHPLRPTRNACPYLFFKI
jgi:hypothetical protein